MSDSILRVFNKRVAILVVAIVTAVLLSGAAAQIINSQYVHAAGSSSISLSPSAKSYEVGDSFTVTASIVGGGESYNAAQVNLTYDAAKLKLTSLNNSGDPFNIDTDEVLSSGSIQQGSGTLSSLTGTNTFMKATFRATAKGTANVQVASGSAVTRSSDSSDAWNGALTTATYSIASAPSSSPDPKPDPKPAPDEPKDDIDTDTDDTDKSDSDKNNDDTEPKVEKTPVDEDPELVVRTFKKAVVRVRTNVKAQVQILYGVDGQTNLSTSLTKFGKNHKISFDPALIEPGRTYSYKAVITDKAGEITETETFTFRATGFRLQLALKDVDGNPLANVRVMLRSEPREGTTDENGKIVFDDVESGQHTASFEVNGKEISQTLGVINNFAQTENGEDIIPLQVTEITVDTTNNTMLYLAIGGLSLLLVAAVVALVMKKRSNGGGMGGASGGTVSPQNQQPINTNAAVSTTPTPKAAPPTVTQEPQVFHPEDPQK